MKLVLVGPAYPLRGGISHYNSSLYRELAAQHDVCIVSFRRLYPGFLFPGSSPYDPGEDVFGAPVREVIDPLKPWTWRQAADVVLRFQPDGVVFQWWHSFFGPAYSSVAARVGRDSNAARILVCHNVFPHERPPKVIQWGERWFVRRMLAHFDGALVHATQELHRLRSLAPALPVDRVAHPTYKFYSRWADGRRQSSSRLRLLFFGTVRPYKGLEVFLRALAQISAGTEVEATIAGEFYVDEARMHRLAEELGVSGLIDWQNRYIPNSEVAALFERADLVVLPYLRATQSGVIAVAFEFGVPVVASDIAGLAEAVRHGETGLLVPPGDPDALAEAVLGFERDTDPDRYRNSIRRAASDRGWSEVTDGILKFIANPARQAL